MYRVLLIGDSIRMGYEPFVRRELEGLAEVLGPEKNGGDSDNVLRNLPEWLETFPADLVHLNCGLHDIKRPFGSSSNGIPRFQYADNLRQIFSHLVAHKIPVIWATSTPVDEKLHHQNKSFDRFEADLEHYNATALEACREFGLEVDDLFGLIERAGKSAYLLDDGVHFKPEGYQLLGREVARVIRAALEKLRLK
ncbi:MAG TPA: GDSL-type esterase/lipase family protein [bacterium]|nr:GDSL-type esterase/lipase family protein [bacterium]HNS48472.1 GDSL-type esterase/lipase family protein [bacterium]